MQGSTTHFGLNCNFKKQLKYKRCVGLNFENTFFVTTWEMFLIHMLNNKTTRPNPNNLSKMLNLIEPQRGDSFRAFLI